MARPKKELPPSKEKQISIRMTNNLYDLLSEEAKIAHMPLTAYIRSLITDRRPIIRQEILLDSRGLLKPLGGLGKIGSNLNQIARYQAIERIPSALSLPGRDTDRRNS